MAQVCFKKYQAISDDVQFCCLQDYQLPFCNAGDCYGQPDVVTLNDLIASSEGIILASPIYNYMFCSSAKNLIELTGQQWRKKVIGFISAAGGHGSYMSTMSIAGSLMLDFHCLIVPRFVYATGDSFDQEKGLLTDQEVIDRLGVLASDHLKLSQVQL